MNSEEKQEPFTTILQSHKRSSQQNVSITLETLSSHCELHLKDLSKHHSTVPIPREHQLKLITSLETFNSHSDLSLYCPILYLFKLSFHLVNIQITSSAIHSLCTFLSEEKPEKFVNLLKDCTVHVIEILYCVALRKKKKTENFDPGWKTKIFFVFCECFEAVVKKNLLVVDEEVIDLCGSVLIDDESKILKVTQKADIELFLAIAVNQLGRNVKVTDCESLVGTISKFLTSAAFSLSDNNKKVALTQQKAVMGFSLLNTISKMLNKPEIFRTVLKLNWEPMLSLYNLAIISFKPTEKMQSFSEDSSALGQLYSEILELALCCINSELEKLPVSLFVQLNKFVNSIQDSLDDSEDTVVKYSLQLLSHYCKLGVKKHKIEELGIVELMFAPIFFKLQTSEEWECLWVLITSTPDHTFWVPGKILSAFTSLIPSKQYLQQLISWFNQQIASSDTFIIPLTETGLLSFMFESISNLSGSKELCIELFIMIKSFIHSYTLPETLNFKLAEFLLSDSQINNTDLFELSLSSFSVLLQKSGQSTYEALIKLLNSIQSFTVLKELIETIQNVLKDSEQQKNCQDLLGRVGIFRSFLKILKENRNKSEMIVLWPAVLEAVRFLIQNNSETKALLKELDLQYLTELLITECSSVAEDLSRASLEIVLYILFDSTNLELFHEVKNSEVAPLAVAMISCCETGLAAYVLEMVEYPYNGMCFNLAGSTRIINKRLNRSSQFDILVQLVQKTFYFSISPLELLGFLRNCKGLPCWKQELLFAAFAKSIENAFVTNQDAVSGLNSVNLSPSTYFLFRQTFSHLTFTSETFYFLPKKDFTILTWAFPLSKTQTCLCHFSDKKSSFQLFVEDQKLEVLYTHDKKTIFKLKTAQVLLEHQWNLICISCQQITKFISSLSILSIFINNRECVLETEGKIVTVSQNFNTLTLGNTIERKLSFNGKIASFLVLSKATQDFSDVYTCSSYLQTPFIPECHSDLQPIESFKFKEIWTNTWFAVTDQNLEDFPEIVTENQAEWISGTDIIKTLAAVGGVEVFLPLLQDSEYKVAVEVLHIVASLCQCSLFELITPKDFFVVLAGAIESIVLPSEELLETFKKIIARLEWNSDLQSEAFKHLMINSVIWNNLDETLQENYIGSISLYISKHLQCKICDIFEFYGHVSKLYLPVEFLTEIFVKVLPKVVEVKDLDAFCFIVFKMAGDNVVLLNRFLIEMNAIRFSKECLREVCFVFLNFLDWPQSFEILPGLLAVLRTVIELVVREQMNDKRTWGEDDTLKQIFVTLDRKIGQDIGGEVLWGIVNICKMAYPFTNRQVYDKFACFVDLLTTRITFLDLDCIKECLTCVSDPQFCSLLTTRPNFPDWLAGCYFSDIDSVQELGIILFSFALQTSFLSKFRVFILTVGRQNLNRALEFYFKILKTVMKMNGFESNPHLFLEFVGVLEDLMNPECSGRCQFDPPTFICILVLLVQNSIFLNLVHCSYPPLPRVDYSLQYELLKYKPMTIVTSPDSIYLREGGFFRLALKLIFIALTFSQSPSLLTALKMLLSAGKPCTTYSFTINPVPSSLLSTVAYERYSLSYPHLPVRNGDFFYTDEFIFLFLLAELTELLNQTADQGILDFLLDILNKCDLFSVLLNFSKKITNKELEDFYRILKEFPHLVRPTSQSRAVANRFEIPVWQTVSLNVFQTNFVDQALLLSDAKHSEHLLRELLVSSNWITRVHIYLIVHTSMQLNFIAGMVKLPNFHIRQSSAPERINSNSHLAEDFSKLYYTFVLNKQEELKQAVQTISTNQQLLHFTKQKKFKKIVKKHLLPEPVDSNRFRLKIRKNFDALGRMGTCKYYKSRFALQRKASFLLTPSKFSSLLKPPVIEQLFESFTDDTETLIVPETDEDIPEENVPELTQNVLFECEQIRMNCSVFGALEISQEKLVFISEGKEKPKGGIYFGSALEFMQECKKSLILLKVAEIAEVFPRRFIHKHTAFEVFLLSGKSYLFNLFTSELREKAFAAMKSWKSVKLVLDPTGSILRSYLKRWKRGELSNLEYLLTLNKFASRSFHDLSQYPIFPWVLKDYTSTELHLEDPSIYRNFKLPIGAQSESAREDAKQRFSMGLDDHPYHFGSHYSSAAIVLHYMVRIEPFAELAKGLQGGRFDIADRLFHSLAASWDSGQGNSGDVKELVPEMFYLPEIFVNSNNERLGVRQDGQTVADVKLPPWASSPADFCRKHLAALESEHVSANLHHWIDLVFGVKQRGKNAKVCFNVFAPMSYEGNFKKVMESGEGEGYLQGMIEQVVHFGQTPVRVFQAGHPAKDQVVSQSTIFDKYKKLDVNFTSGCRVKGEVCAILLTAKYLLLIKKTNTQASILRISLNDLDNSAVLFERKKEIPLINCRLHQNAQILTFATLGENRLVSGYHLDHTFKIHSLNGNLLASVLGHTNLISCLYVSGATIITGSLDSTIFSWQFQINKPRLCCKFLGHRSGIVQLNVLDSFFLLFSLEENGDILVHDLRSGEFFQYFATGLSRFSVSSCKFIAGTCKNEILVMDWQGKTVFRKTGQGNFVGFDRSGEFLCYCTEAGWGFCSLFDEHKKYEKKEEGGVIGLIIATLQNYFVYLVKGGKYSFVYTCGVVNKENIMTNQRINF